MPFKSNVTFFDITVKSNSLLKDVKELYSKLRPNEDLGDIETQILNGGLINSMIRVSDSKGNKPVVVRVYELKLYNQNDSENADLMFSNRMLELAVIEKAADLNITAKLIARFKNGIVIDFIEGEDLNVKSFDNEVADEIGRKVARFHTIKLDGLTAKEATLYTELKDEKTVQKRAKDIESYDKRMKEDDMKDFKEHLPLFSEIEKEYNYLFNLLLEKDALGQTLCCHNDLSMSNIMVEKTTKTPYLIDFEMADTNYQYYDIAKLFTCMGGNFGKSFKPEDLPSDELMKRFLRSYFIEWNKLNKIQMTNDQLDEHVDKELVKVIANMLLSRVFEAKIAIYFQIVHPMALEREPLRKFAINKYNDYLKNKDKHIKMLLEQKSGVAWNATIWKHALVILLVMLGHFVIKRLFNIKI